MGANVTFTSTHDIKAGLRSLEPDEEVILLMAYGKEIRGYVQPSNGDVLFFEQSDLMSFSSRVMGTWTIAWSEIAAYAIPRASVPKVQPQITNVTISNVGGASGSSGGGKSAATSCGVSSHRGEGNAGRAPDVDPVDRQQTIRYAESYTERYVEKDFTPTDFDG